jgi:F-type H+-transporting ATPase subunit epsilon
MVTADVHEDLQAKPSAGKKGSDILQCVVVTPERTQLDELVAFVAVPLYDGELGVLPGRAPLIGRLGYGELRVGYNGTTKRFFIDGGFVQVRDNVVTVLTHHAIPQAQVDPVVAGAELKQALALPSTNDAQFAEKDRAIARARAKLRIAPQRG